MILLQPTPKVGIAGIGTYIPDRYMTAKELSEATNIPEDVIALKFGVKRKPIPGIGDTTSRMGIEAAKKALQNANTDPMDVDLLIWNGAQHKDYPCWLAGLKVAEAIGAKRAWSFDMEAMCGSMMAGMDIAKSIMLARDDVNTVLLVSGYRNVDLINLKNPATSFMLDIGASGAAVVLKKNHDRNVVLSSAFKGDGSFSEDCVVPVGGSMKWPMESGDVARYSFDVTGDAADFKKRLGEKTMPNFYAVIRESLQKSGYSQNDIDYLAILHFKKSAHFAVLEELGLGEDQSTYLDEYGHLGQNDQILSIELGLASGKIKDGDLIVMVGAGLGFVWAATTVKWGRDQEEKK
ncbi:MAG TPA: 3-oxoacyl-ACP synthase [Mesotoga infera]|nr:3-oxoacyl-ACP synthase [Mesotoga infera]HRV02999.1 3-oxoacyl-ACP synthase [Mesotoga sp.]